MYEIKRYRMVPARSVEFVGIDNGYYVVQLSGWDKCNLHRHSNVEPIPDPVPEFATARENLGRLQKLLLDGKLPHCLSTIRPLIAEHRGWQCEVVDGISCWVPPPPKSPLELAIELAEPLAEKMDGPVYVDTDRLKLLVDAARKLLAAEKGGGA